jgi:hypothetical protein
MLELGGKRPMINWTHQNIRMFTSSDTIFIDKNEHGYDRSYHCQFVKFERGVVHGVVIVKDSSGSKATRNYTEYGEIGVGQPIRARLDHCLLWGRKPGEHVDRCQWFNKEGFAV